MKKSKKLIILSTLPLMVLATTAGASNMGATVPAKNQRRNVLEGYINENVDDMNSDSSDNTAVLLGAADTTHQATASMDVYDGDYSITYFDELVKSTLLTQTISELVGTWTGSYDNGVGDPDIVNGFTFNNGNDNDIGNLEFSNTNLSATVPAIYLFGGVDTGSVTVNVQFDYATGDGHGSGIMDLNFNIENDDPSQDGIDYFSRTNYYYQVDYDGSCNLVYYPQNFKKSEIENDFFENFFKLFKVKSDDNGAYYYCLDYDIYEDGEMGSYWTSTINGASYNEISTDPFSYLTVGTNNMNVINSEMVANDNGIGYHATGRSYELNLPFDIVPTLEDGATKVIPVSSDSHYTQAEILDLISAQDLFGKECDIEVVSSDYEDAIGEYTIVIAASDEYGQTATATLTIVVLDKTAPLMVKKNDLTISYGDIITEDELLACVSASDNSGVIPTLEITDYDGFDFGVAAEFGSYSLAVRATDEAGNYSELHVMINVTDKIAPVITKNNGSIGDLVQYGFSNSHGLSEEVLLNQYTATDEIDGVCELKVKSGEVKNNIGTHTVTIAAQDRSGNESTLNVTYEILADIPPVFILDSKLVQVSSDYPLTKDDVLRIAKAMAPKDTSYVTLSNDEDYAAYKAGSDQVGSKYKIAYSFMTVDNNVEGDSFTLEVADETGSMTDKSAWQSFLDFWKNIGKAISNFFHNIGKFFRNIGTCFKSLFSGEGWNWADNWELLD